VEPYLRNIEAWCWRYKENTRNYPGFHLSAKPLACDALIACLRQLCGEGDGTYRTIPLKHLRPEDEAKISGGQAYECFSRLRITFHGDSEALHQMSIRAEGDIVRLDFTEAFLPLIEKGLSDVKAGTGDYSIGPRKDSQDGGLMGELDQLSECLWFWPCFGHLQVNG